MKNLRVIRKPLWRRSRDNSSYLKEVIVYDVVCDHERQDLKELALCYPGLLMAEGGQIVETFDDRDNAELFILALKNRSRLKRRVVPKFSGRNPARMHRNSRMSRQFNEEGC